MSDVEGAKRLEQIAKLALIPLIGYAAVKYLHKGDKRIYIMHYEEAKAFTIGYLEDGKQRIAEFGGQIIDYVKRKGGQEVIDLDLSVEQSNLQQPEIDYLETLVSDETHQSG